MEHLINHEVKNIEISGIRKFFNLVNDKEDILSLTIGQPDFSTPKHIKQAAIDAIDSNQTSYTANAGMLSLRRAVSTYVKDLYRLDYDPNQILITVGASQAIDITLRTILNTGDEVILPGPVYPGYQPLIELAGAKAIHIDTRKSQFKITADQLEQAITAKTKCVILPYPSNPTGVSLTEQELREIAAVLSKYDLFILTDEIYSTLTYEQDHFSIAQIDEVKDRTIVINGLSKSHAMTGWRIGFLLAPIWLTPHLTKVLQYNVSCASSISQHAALKAFSEGIEDSLEMNKAYRKRRDYVYDRLVNMGLEVIKPDGAFYFFIKIPSEQSSFDLALELVDTVKLALIPGDSFSEYGEGYLRLSYAYSLATLKDGLNRLEHFLHKNK